MERNLVHHTTTGSFFQTYGKENRIRNNIFAFATRFQLEGTKPEPHVSFYFEHNIVYWDNDGPLLGGCHSASPPCEVNFRLDHNLYWNAAGKPLVFPGNLSLEQWREKRGQDRHSIVADPLFVDTNNNRFQLMPVSPALKLGFQPFDATKAGPQAPAVLTKDLPTVSAGYQ
jgi:hypothetical protein